MIKDGKFRFTLQFGMNTQEELQAGKLLEQLGKRKSPIVVAALNEYLANHPELLTVLMLALYPRKLSTPPTMRLQCFWFILPAVAVTWRQPNAWKKRPPVCAVLLDFTRSHPATTWQLKYCGALLGWLFPRWIMLRNMTIYGFQ